MGVFAIGLFLMNVKTTDFGGVLTSFAARSMSPSDQDVSTTPDMRRCNSSRSPFVSGSLHFYPSPRTEVPQSLHFYESPRTTVRRKASATCGHTCNVDFAL